MASSFHIENFGCRAARADGEAIGQRLAAAGQSIQQENEAEVVIVNTCSVTAEADRAARAFIRRTHRLNPEARIVVTGCYAQRAPEELASLPGVAAVVGNSHKAFAPQIALELAESYSAQTHASFVPLASLVSGGNIEGPPMWVDDLFAHSLIEEAQPAPGIQTRPNLKIQEGCSNRCTFCVIPQTRGPSKSLPERQVLERVRGFVAVGGLELVLSGINLGRWGRDLPSGPNAPRLTLASLVRRILEQTSLPRLRLSSIEPMDWDGELIALLHEFGGSRLARHAHLPLQSGSDSILRRMHRRYRPWHYAEKVSALYDAAGPALTLGADVMVGFPGETDQEFDETCSFVRSVPFGYLHLFPFSPRPGTRGWMMHGESPVPSSVMDHRMETLRSIAREKSETHRRQFIGRTLDVITLRTPTDVRSLKRTVALSDNFLPVHIEGLHDPNRLVRTRVSACNSGLTLISSLDEEPVTARV